MVVDIWSRYLNIHYLRTGEKKGRASARNLGIVNAKGEILIFLDDDMIVTPDFIQRHYELHKKYSDIVVIGYRHRLTQRVTELFNYITPINISMNANNVKNLPCLLDERESVYKAFKDDLEACPVPWVCLYSNNFSVRKTHLLSVENFCEVFQKKWGVEDVELGYRLHKQGLRYVLCREANGYHLPHFVSWKKNLTELEDNLALFTDMYSDVEVELYSQYMKIGLLKYIESISLFRKLIREKDIAISSSNGTTVIRDFLKGNVQGKVLLLGKGDGYILNEFKPEVCFDPVPDGVNTKQLLGVKTNYDTGYFDTVVINGFIGIFQSYLPLVIHESCRVGKVVLFIIAKDVLQEMIKCKECASENRLEDTFISWFVGIGIPEEKILLEIVDDYCLIKISSQYDEKELKFNLALTLDLDKPSDATVSGIGMALSLENIGFNVQIEHRKQFEYFHELSGIKIPPKMNYLSEIEKQRVSNLINNDLRMTGKKFFELPLSRITNNTTNIISWFNHSYLGFSFYDHIEFYNSEVDIVWHFSEQSAKYFLENGGMASKSFVVPSGVNEKFFSPIDTGIRKKFVFMAYLTPFKEHGIDILLDSYCNEFTSKDQVSLCLNFLPLDFEFEKGFYHTAIGWDYYNKFLDQYKMLYESKMIYYQNKYMKNSDAEIFVEYCDLDVGKRLKHYHNCDCYVHLYRNDFVGDKVMQAMACGKPTLVVDKFLPANLCSNENSYIIDSAITTAVNHEYAAFSEYYLWAEPNNISVRKSMRQAFENRLETKEKGHWARQNIINNWTWNHFAIRALNSLSVNNAINLEKEVQRTDVKDFNSATLYERFRKERLIIY